MSTQNLSVILLLYVNLHNDINIMHNAMLVDPERLFPSRSTISRNNIQHFYSKEAFIHCRYSFMSRLFYPYRPCKIVVSRDKNSVVEIAVPPTP